ncbi:helix-turn-helix domain-containing protein [Streptacidiphilus rugosus]|uniref:helix-turn-helix domain-containing protein n=1 Tax=Streptacidiphilus rugosus TaxID=405783 RepID=UPI00056643DB|nr:helix-turn-helix transcriptional regulator [Streptacidiphilus rugosus]
MKQGDVVADFLHRLRQLRVEAGSPSYRTMARASGAVSHSALHEAVTGRRLPSWPVVREFVKACGGEEADWRRSWAAASSHTHEEAHRVDQAVEPVVEHPVEQPVELPAPGPFAPPAVAGHRRSWPAARLATHGAALLAGVLIGAFAVGYATGGPASAARTSGGPIRTAADCRNAISDDGVQMAPAAYTLQATTPAAAPAPAAGADRPSPSPAWVGRAASEAQIITGTDTTVPITQNVTAGDALIVSIMLTSTCPAPLTVTDSRGNQYKPVADVFDTRHHRVVVLAAFDVAALSTDHHLLVTYITASKYHVTVDEYRDVHDAVAHVTGHGESGGTAFGLTAPPACRPGQLLVGAVGSNSGNTPVLHPGWTALPLVKLSSYKLTTGYQLVRAPGPCTLVGSTTAQWGAALVVLQ